MSLILKNIPIVELEAEIARRKKIPGPPPPLEKPNFEKLHKMITDGVQTQILNGYEDEDFSHYVYEQAMEAVYGERVYWEWKRARGW